MVVAVRLTGLPAQTGPTAVGKSVNVPAAAASVATLSVPLQLPTPAELSTTTQPVVGGMDEVAGFDWYGCPSNAITQAGPEDS